MISGWTEGVVSPCQVLCERDSKSDGHAGDAVLEEIAQFQERNMDAGAVYEHQRFRTPVQ